MSPGITAPPGTALVESPTWFDGAVTITNSGGSLTANGSSTFNGPVTLGTVAGSDLATAVTPASAGLLAWDFPYAQANGTGSAATTAGALYLAKLPITTTTNITNLYFRIATAASGATTAQNFGMLFNSAGSRVAVTGDLTTAIGTNTGAIQAPLSAVYSAAPGNYWAGFYFNASVTLPVLGVYIGQTAVTTAVVFFGSTTAFGSTAAKYPFAVSATGSLTTTPPTSITMASNTATGAYPFWVGAN